MRKKIGPLNCLVREGENERDVILILHGFGADASDLFPLADYLDSKEQWTFVCPNAPLEVAIGGGFSVRGWFPLSLRELEAGVDFQNVKPPGLDTSAAAVGDVIFELNPERLVLGGFSQGAMIATEVALRNPEDVTGLILLSTTLLDQTRWRSLAAGLKGKPILQSHGSADQVLPLGSAQNLTTLLRAAEAKVEFMGFGGGHEIPAAVLSRAARFITEL